MLIPSHPHLPFPPITPGRSNALSRRPVSGASTEKAVFAYFWPLWPKSKSPQRRNRDYREKVINQARSAAKQKNHYLPFPPTPRTSPIPSHEERHQAPAPKKRIFACFWPLWPKSKSPYMRNTDYRKKVINRTRSADEKRPSQKGTAFRNSSGPLLEAATPARTNHRCRPFQSPPERWSRFPVPRPAGPRHKSRRPPREPGTMHGPHTGRAIRPKDAQ